MTVALPHMSHWAHMVLSSCHEPCNPAPDRDEEVNDLAEARWRSVDIATLFSKKAPIGASRTLLLCGPHFENASPWLGISFHEPTRPGAFRIDTAMFSFAVCVIVGFRSEEQVFWTNAVSDVAAMQDIHSVRDRSEVNLP